MSLLKKIKSALGTIPVPGWLFTGALAVYCELLLHFWVNPEPSFFRVVTVLLFGIGFGSILSFLTSFFGAKPWSKWVTVLLTFLIGAFYLAEFFCQDAYKAFMTLGMMLGGAKGVATGFGGVVVGTVLGDLKYVFLVMAPVLLYALFACPAAALSIKRRLCIGLCAVVFYGLAFSAVFGFGTDGDKLVKSYNFDTAVRVFGLNMGVTLDSIHGSSVEMEEQDFTASALPALPQEDSDAPQPEEESGVEYAYHTIEGLDFDALAESTRDVKTANIHRYIASLTPAKENAYTGLFKGKNLILITAEAFTKQVIDPELTPTLYRMATKGIHFTDYYQPAWGGSTTTGEFSNVVGLIPTTAGMCMKQAVYQKLFLTMGHQLQKEGYFSAAYHNHNHDFYDRNKTHTHLGYDNFYGVYGGLEGIDHVWPESDLQMIDVTVPQYIDQQPFSIYYMTVSGHCGYTMKENAQTRKNYHLVEHLDYSENVKYYLASQMELEHAMASLVKQLEDAGIADDTVVVISADHYPYGLERSTAWKNTSGYLNELYGMKKTDMFIRDSNALILWSGCLEDKNIEVNEPVYSLDILPTLSNLFGVEYDSRLLVGRDVFSDEMPLVLWPNHSWKTEKGIYDSMNRVFLPAEGQEQPSEEYIQYVSDVVHNKFTYSDRVQDVYYFKTLSKILGIQ